MTHPDQHSVKDATHLALARDFDHVDKLNPGKEWWKLQVFVDRTSSDSNGQVLGVASSQDAPERSEVSTGQSE